MKFRTAAASAQAMAATPSVLAVVLGHNRSKARTLQVSQTGRGRRELVRTGPLQRVSALHCCVPLVGPTAWRLRDAITMWCAL